MHHHPSHLAQTNCTTTPHSNTPSRIPASSPQYLQHYQSASSTPRSDTVVTKPLPTAQPLPRLSATTSPDYKNDILQHYFRTQQSSVVQDPFTVHGASSVSSAAGSSMTTTAGESLDLEKGMVHHPQQQQDWSRSKRGSREVMSSAPVQLGKREDYIFPVGATPFDRRQSTARQERVEEEHVPMHDLEAMAMKILLLLSGPCAALSTLSFFWTLFSVIVSLLLQPLRLFTSRPTLRTTLISSLAPPLRLQLEFIYASPIPSTSATDSYSLSALLLVLLISPVLSLGMAVAAWTVGLYWILAAIVGNPDGLDGRNDGRETVLGLRRFWERWLKKGIKN